MLFHLRMNNSPTKLLRNLFVAVCKFFPTERGKFSILQRVYFRYFSSTDQETRVARIRFGARMRLDPNEFLQAHILLFGSYELPTVRFIRRLLRDGDTVFDIGAQIGYLTLMSKLARKGVTVWSFEPEKTNAIKLRENLSLNNFDMTHVVEKAVSNVSGSIRLYLSKDHNAGTHSTIPNESTIDVTRFVDLPAIRLDDFAKEQGISKLALIKIDVEGGELEVIEGAREVLHTLQPVVIAELSDAIQESRGSTTQEFKRILLDLGYLPFRIQNDGRLTEVPVEAGHLMDNIAFVPQAKLDTYAKLIHA